MKEVFDVRFEIVNNVKKICRNPPSDVKFSVIDRWASHPLLAAVFAERIKEKLLKFPEEKRNEVVILYSAHSLPLKVVI